MTTSYTCIIEDDEPTFEEYLLRCARGMSPCASQREEDLSRPPRLQEVKGEHLGRANKARERLAKLAAMSPAECEAAAQTEHTELVASFQQCVDERARLNEKYAAMRAAAVAWKAPTLEHAPLRVFMIQQIDQETKHMAFDLPAARTGAQWLADSVAQATRDLEYDTKQHTREVEHVRWANAWITALLESVKGADK